MSSPNSIERDVRKCALGACHRVGLYAHVRHPNDPRFLNRPCHQLVDESGATCPVHPPYNDYLLSFRQALRQCLRDKGYDVVRVYLQRLCTEGYTWGDLCRYHADRL
jgi:hypothetical protein